ncbi:MAG: ribosomal protein L11 [Candidatus Midichloriaceae bacterium]|jgi:ribosomal protein L11
MKNNKNIIFVLAATSSLLFNNVNACDSNASEVNTEVNTEVSTDVKVYKRFDYSMLIKDASDDVKKEVDQYYDKLDEAYVNLSEEAKEEVRKIANYKRKKFSKKKYSKKKHNEKKKDINS